MRSLAQLFALFNELIFMLVGALLLWVALSGRYLFDPRRGQWLVVCGILIVWGLRTWRRARLAPAKGQRAAMKIGGGSLVLVGLILLSLAWAPFRVAGLLLAAAGGIFVLRGIVTAVFLVRPS